MRRAVRRLGGVAAGQILAAAVLLTAQPLNRLTAQVGHDPAHSPYHDIPLRAGPTLFVGHLSNDRGRVGAGVSNALTFGIHYDIPSGRSLLFQFTAAYLSGDRFIIDPRADSASPQRKTGPYQSDLVLTELGAQLRLTGAKSWRGFVPYLGIGLGLVYDAGSPGDTTGSGYDFGTKFTLSGSTGMRLFLSRRLMINGDLRGQMWRLRYPIAFQQAASDGSRVVPIGKDTDWTLHPWISLGVGWTF